MGFATYTNGELKTENGQFVRDDLGTRTKKAIGKWWGGELADGVTVEEIKDPDTGKKKKVYRDANGKEIDEAAAYKSVGVSGAIGQGLTAFGKGAKDWFDQQTMANAGKHFADGFLKGVGDLSGAVGLDKMMKGMTDIFSGGLTFKGGVWGEKPKPEGDKLQESLAARQEDLAKLQHSEVMETNKEIAKALKDLSRATTENASKLGTLSTGFTKLSEEIKNSNKRGSGSGN